jgi:hypothetical protein
MHISLHRLQHDELGTIGHIKINGKPMVFSLEDAPREEKIPGKTSIPKGTYNLKLRTDSPMSRRYANKYDFHKGMLWLQDVPDYEWVYIHVGNDEDDTEGCILVGMTANLNTNEKVIGQSVNAYKKIYPQIADAILSGEEVLIEIT